jgi:hypothetical protein
MEPCTILDLPVIYDILYDNLGESDNLHMMTRNDIIGGTTKFFLEDDRLIIFRYIGQDKYDVHIHSVSRDSRGKGLRDFAVRASRWMIDNLGAKSFLNFVDNDRLDLKVFMRMVGAKRIGIIPGTNQILYVSAEGMGIREEA